MRKDSPLVKEKIMAGKISKRMKQAVAMYESGYRLPDSARHCKVTPRGLRYALLRKKERMTLDKRK